MDKILAAASSGVIFAKSFFRDPHDPSKPLHLHSYQERFMNLIDFGYDIETGLKPTEPPQYAILKTPRQYGKTTAIAVLIATQLIRFTDARIAIASISDDRAKDILGVISNFIHNSPFADMIIREKVDEITLSNGSFVKSHPQSSSIRGTSNDWLYFDEAGYMTDKFILEDAVSTVRFKGMYKRQKTPDIILTSTPPASLDSFFVRTYINGLNRREIVCRSCGYRNNVNAPEFKDLSVDEFGLHGGLCPQCESPDLHIVYNGIISYSPSPFESTVFTKEEILADLDRKGNTPAARREILGEIVTDASALIRGEWIEKAVDPTLMNYASPQSNDLRYVMGVDFGRVSDATVFCIGHRVDHIIYLDYIKVIPGEGGHTYGDIRAEFLSLAYRFAPSMVVPDGTGIGNPLVEQMQKDLIALTYEGVQLENLYIPPNPALSPRIYSNKKNHKGFYYDYNSKVDLIENLINLFQLNFIRIPPSHVDDSTAALHRELRAFNYVDTKNGRIKYGVQSEHDDTVNALALMAWGLKSSVSMIATAYYDGEDNYVL